MANPRITKKERNLIKGALRRVFSRSELRNKIIADSVILGYTNTDRPKVKTWCRCRICNKPEARSYMAADHISPLIPVDQSFEELSLDTVVDRLWCEENNLQSVCPVCHSKKTKEENALRRKHKKGNK